jgi:hypothetical protein
MSIGVIYIATGHPLYGDLAVVSATSLKRVMPEMPVTVLTDLERQWPNIDNVISITSSGDGFKDKILFMPQSPYSYTLFMDTDTYVCGAFSEIFPILDKFDIAAIHDPFRRHAGWVRRFAQFAPDVPAAFAEMNTGIILYKKSPQMEDFFTEWLKLYEDQPARDKLTADQPFFRVALYRSNLRVATLPHEYNCQFRTTGYVYDSVKILHGHVMSKIDHFEKVTKAVNACEGARVYIGGKIYAQRDVGRLFARRVARYVARYPEPPRNVWLLRLNRLAELSRQAGLRGILTRVLKR